MGACVVRVRACVRARACVRVRAHSTATLPPTPHPTPRARSITRNNLGPHKTVCIVIPCIFFVTSLVVDYVLYAVRGFDGEGVGG